MQTYIGHHTCSIGGGYAKVLKEAPFLSEWPKEEDDYFRTPYLGEGYYFWQHDLDQAKKWGRQRYSNWYYIVEANINTTESNFLDLIGNPFHIRIFLLACAKLVQDGTIDSNYTLGEAIEYLKKASKNNKNIFPWVIIRAKDEKPNQTKIYFKKSGLSHTYLGGNFIICIIEKNDIILTNKRIVFQSQISG